jgi:hypothetical protein
MEHRFTFTDMELEYMKENYGWLANYYRPLQGATIEKVYLGVSADEDMIVLPVMELVTASGERYVCDIVCANELESPGFISGLPFDPMVGK